MNNKFYTLTLLLSALTVCSTVNAMQSGTTPEHVSHQNDNDFEREVLDSSTDDEASTDEDDRPFNLLRSSSNRSVAAVAALLVAPPENLDDLADDPSPKAEKPVTAQQQQAPEQPIITLGQLMRQSTLESVDFCIENFIHHNPTLRDELEAGLARIERQMHEAEFTEGLHADITKFYATDRDFALSTPKEQGEILTGELEFKKAQFKAFAFAQLFEEQEIASPPASPRRRTYQARLTGTPPTSPRKNQGAKRTVSFREETDIEIIPNVKRDTKRARHS